MRRTESRFRVVLGKSCQRTDLTCKDGQRTNEGLPEGNVSDERVLEKSESLIQREKSCVGEDHGKSFGRLL